MLLLYVEYLVLCGCFLSLGVRIPKSEPSMKNLLKLKGLHTYP